jgi:Domain of unknown function (DUF4265)
MSPNTPSPLVKVLFWLEDDAWHGYTTETVWAEHAEDNHFRLRNVPFHVFGVSVEDIVSADLTDQGLIFTNVLFHAGHSTYRIITNETTTEEQLAEYWAPLENLGCTYEQGMGRLRAIDVPPEADIAAIYALLENGEIDGIWEFEEGHCGHLLRQGTNDVAKPSPADTET